MSGLRTVSGKLPYSGSNFTVVPSILAADGVTWRTFRLVTQATNLITNPAGRTTSGTVTSRTNICQNPSFELNTNGWSTTDPGLGNAAQYGSDSTAGTKSLATPGSGAYCVGNTTTASVSYTASIYVKHQVAGAKGNVWVVESPNPASTIGNMRYALAKNGPGYLSEESTTNLWTNPSMEVNVTGYSSLASGATLTRDTGTFFMGGASLKVQRLNTADFRLVRLSYSKDDNSAVFLMPGTYTFSCWVKGNAGQGSNQVAPAFESQPQGNSGYATGTITSTTYASLNGTWQRASTTFNVTGSGTAVLNINTYVSGATSTGAVNDTFYVDCVQLEAKNYASSYADGSLGSGYVWDATTNLVSNPSFETNTTGWAPADAAQGTIARNTGAWFSGTASMTTPSGAYTTLTSTANATYASTCWVKTNGGAAGTTAQLFHVKSPATTQSTGPGLRYALTKNGPGPLVEENTINLCLNPNVVGLSSVVTAASGVTLTADATQAYIGSGSAKVVCDGTVSAQGVQFYSCEQPAGTYIGSMWVKGSSGVQLNVWTRAYNSSSATIKDGTTTLVTLNGGWQRLTTTPITVAVSDGNIAQLAVMARTASATATTFWADNAQIEPKAYTTTYADGALGTGYSWDTTTNLVTNPSFETDTSSWSANGPSGAAGITLTRDTTQFKFGVASMKVAVDGTTGNFQGATPSSITATTGDVHTISAWVRGNAGGEVIQLSASYRDVNGATVGSGASAGVTLTTSWQRVVITTPAAGTAVTQLKVFVQTGSTTTPYTWFVDGVQVEKRAYATPFGNTGVANTVSSTRANATLRYAPTATALSAVSLLATAKVGTLGSLSSQPQFLADLNHQSTTDSLRLTINPNGSLIAQLYANNVQLTAVTTATGVVPNNATVTALATYDGANVKLYYSVNGAAVVTQSNAATGTFGGAADSIAIGNNPFNNASQLNGSVENVMVFNTVMDATTATNMVNGSSLPSTSAARADCTFSAFVNDPVSPWVTVQSSGGYSRLFRIRTTTPGEIRTDLVVLSTGADSVNQLYVDAAQVESRSYATPYGNVGTANTVSSTRTATSSLTWTTTSVSSTATLLFGVKINDALRQRAALSTYPAVARLYDGTNQIVAQLGPTGNIYGQKNIAGVPYAATHSPAQNVNSGDYVMMAVTIDASGNVTSNVSINGSAVNSATYTGNTGTLTNANTLYALGGVIENLMLFNTVLSGTTLTNILTGVTLPSAAAARSDCIFSSFVNDPQTLALLAPNVWTRVNTTAKLSPRATRSDFVFLTDTPSGAAGSTLIDGNLVERGTALLSYFDGDHRAHLRENLVINPSAEVLSTGWGAYPGTGGAATFTRNTDGGYSGSAYMRYTWTTSPTVTNGGVYSMNNPVVAGTTYTGSMYVRSSVAQKVVLTFEWKKQDGSNVSTSGGSVVTLAPNTWTRLSNTATAPALAVSTTMTAYVTTGGAIWNPGDWMDGDAAMLEASSTLNSYFDGDTAGSSWMGATGNSLSYTYDPEFSAAWTVSANASGSIMRANGVNRWTHTTGNTERTVPYQHTEAGVTFTRYLVPGGSEAAPYRIALIGNGDDFSSIVPGDVLTAIFRARVGGSLAPYTLSNFTICQGSTAGSIGAQFTPTPSLTTAWQEFTATATVVNAPSGTVAVYISMPNGAVATDGWLDVAHIAIIRGNFPGPYFDGSGPYTPEPDYIYSWSGAADASTSIATP